MILPRVSGKRRRSGRSIIRSTTRSTTRSTNSPFMDEGTTTDSVAATSITRSMVCVLDESVSWITVVVIEVDSVSSKPSMSSSSCSTSVLVFKGWLNLLPSRYSALAFKPSSQLNRYDAPTSETVASVGKLMVFEMAPEMKGCAAAII